MRISLVKQIEHKYLFRIIEYDLIYREGIIRSAQRAFGNSMDSYWAVRYLDKCNKTFIAVFDNKVVGAVMIGYIKLHDSLHAEIGYIFVDPDYRHMGIGSALLSKAIEFLKENGIKAVWALTSPRNIATRFLFKKFGFKEFANPRELKEILRSKDIGKLLYRMVYWRGDVILYLPLIK